MSPRRREESDRSKLCRLIGKRVLRRRYNTKAILALLRDPHTQLSHSDTMVENNLLLLQACASGSAEIVRELAQPRFGITKRDATSYHSEFLEDPLDEACCSGSVAIVEMLGRPPFDLGAENARSLDCRCLITACRRGHAAILDALAKPPYSLGHDDAVRCCAMDHVLRCTGDHADVIARLKLPPYSIDAGAPSSIIKADA